MTIILYYKCTLHAGSITVLKLLTLPLNIVIFLPAWWFLCRDPLGFSKLGYSMIIWCLIYDIEGFVSKFRVVPCVCQLQKIFATNRLLSRKLTNFIILFFTVPLLSRILPSDVCKVYKKGCSIRWNMVLWCDCWVCR